MTVEHFLVLLLSIRIHVLVSVRECMIDYFIETACIYICALLCSYHVKCYVLIIMSICAKRQELWRTVRDMRLGKCSIIIIILFALLCTTQLNRILIKHI